MAYRRILLGVDSSPRAADAITQAGVIAAAFGSSVVAAHVFAARLHDQRFEDLEPGLPEKYRDPKRLERSRRTHDSLIGKGLELISDSYIEDARSKLDGFTVEGRSLEGKNYLELAKESTKGYDLAMIGSRGLGLESVNGATPPDALGSVCERFLRMARTDVLVVKDARPLGEKILVSVDGSPESYAALRKALRLAEAAGGSLEVTTCFDPNFHPVAFRSIAEVLSEKDAKVFRFKEQEKLHDEIIDGGLENLYRGYLRNAELMAEGRKQRIETRLLAGKPAYEVAARAREMEPTLLVVSRFGMHRTEELDIGATAETLVRLAPCNVLVVNETPDEAPLQWTEEAEQRLAPIPTFMRPIVKKAVESHARSRGLDTITGDVVTAAKTCHGVRMPGHGEEDR